MEEDHDDIAALFEAELRDLDNYDSGDEYDESIAQLDALGANLRETLRQDDEDGDKEWENMMTMRRAHDRFHILEEAVSMDSPGVNASDEQKGSPSSPSPSSISRRKKKNRNTQPAGGSRSPSPGGRKSPSSRSASPRLDNGEEEEKEKDYISADTNNLSKYAPGSMVIEPLIVDLMDTMLNAVTSVAAMSVREEQQEVGHVSVDMSHLPKLFTEQDEEEMDQKQRKKSVKFARGDFETSAYVFCYTIVLPSFLVCDVSVCLSLIHLLLPACIL
jgi:hypothetical protein